MEGAGKAWDALQTYTVLDLERWDLGCGELFDPEGLGGSHSCSLFVAQSGLKGMSREEGKSKRRTKSILLRAVNVHRFEQHGEPTRGGLEATGWWYGLNLTRIQFFLLEFKKGYEHLKSQHLKTGTLQAKICLCSLSKLDMECLEACDPYPHVEVAGRSRIPSGLFVSGMSNRHLHTLTSVNTGIYKPQCSMLYLYYLNLYPQPSRDSIILILYISKL